MKEVLPNPTLEACQIQATVSNGFVVKTREGAPARLALIDEHGNVIEAAKTSAAVSARSHCQNSRHRDVLTLLAKSPCHPPHHSYRAPLATGRLRTLHARII